MAWSWLADSADRPNLEIAPALLAIGPDSTDRGKDGVKRNLLTEGHGIPAAIVIDGANRHDMKLAKWTLEDLKLNRPMPTAALPQGRGMAMMTCATLGRRTHA